MYTVHKQRFFLRERPFLLLLATKKAPDWVLLLYFEVVAAVVVGGLVLPVEVDKVFDN